MYLSYFIIIILWQLYDASSNVHYLSKIATHLHGDDPEVIFLIAPDEEGLLVVVVDATASWPETASVGSLKETIAFLEEEVVVDELLLDFLAHAREWVERALELAFKTGQGAGDLVLHLLVLGLGEAGVEGVSFHGSTASYPGRHDEFALKPMF